MFTFKKVGVLKMFDYRDFDSSFQIICCLIGAIIMCFIFLKIYDRTPPETIEKDGYTYTLYEELPEEFIEYNGYTYRLGDSVNE